MIQKTILPYHLQEEKNESTLTSFGGLLPWLELAKSCGLLQTVHESFGIQKPNCFWSDASILFGLVLLNLAGGESVEDIDRLEADGGLCRFFRRFVPGNVDRSGRKLFERTMVKCRKRAFPSKSKLFSWLDSFHDAGEMAGRVAGKAFIPQPNSHLTSLGRLNKRLCNFVFKKNPCTKATLDVDATLVETHHRSAKYCYKGFSAYQPLNVWWAEQKMMLHSEFRDGNVNAGFDLLRVFREAVEMLPSEVTEVNLRSDSAAYQWELLRWCERKDKFHPELTVGFAVGASICEGMKKEIAKIDSSSWVAFHENSEENTRMMGKMGRVRKWAELSWVPEQMGGFTRKENYRFLVLREPIQTELPGGDEPDLPFPSVKLANKRYKIQVIVTNKEGDGEELIRWYFKRAGDSEQAHSILKSDLAGGRMPSDKFGVNAAWWQISVISLNLLAIMQQLVWKGKWATKRLKAIRFWLIQIPARVIERSRQLTVKLVNNSVSFAIWNKAREAIFAIREGP